MICFRWTTLRFLVTPLRIIALTRRPVFHRITNRWVNAIYTSAWTNFFKTKSIENCKRYFNWSLLNIINIVVSIHLETFSFAQNTCVHRFFFWNIEYTGTDITECRKNYARKCSVEISIFLENIFCRKKKRNYCYFFFFQWRRYYFIYYYSFLFFQSF